MAKQITMNSAMKTILSDRLHYYASRVLDRASPFLLNASTSRSVTATFPTILLTAGFNGNLGDQALLSVSRSACLNAGHFPLALSYENNSYSISADSKVVMAGGEIGDEFHLKKLVDLQNRPSLTRISSIAFANTFISNPCPRVVQHLSQMEFVHVRDKANALFSSESLGLPNVFYAPDITFSLYPNIRTFKQQKRKPVNKDERKKVVINVQSFFCNLTRGGMFVPAYQLSRLIQQSSSLVLEDAISGYIQCFADLIRYHKQKNDDVLIYTFSAADSAFSRIIIKQAGVKVPVKQYSWNLCRLMKDLTRCDLLYACRYHAHIAGIVAQIPTISVVVGMKNRGLLSDMSIDTSISSLGREEFMNPVIATEALLAKSPFVLEDPWLAELSEASKLALDKCYQGDLAFPT